MVFACSVLSSLFGVGVVGPSGFALLGGVSPSSLAVLSSVGSLLLVCWWWHWSCVACLLVLPCWWLLVGLWFFLAWFSGLRSFTMGLLLLLAWLESLGDGRFSRGLAVSLDRFPWSFVFDLVRSSFVVLYFGVGFFFSCFSALLLTSLGEFELLKLSKNTYIYRDSRISVFYLIVNHLKIKI